ncbi:MAG: hypothetical protein QME96_19100, partial [Myxococcota bacterium]|nr:hypothetical protein [Myxococcota bacterium]
GPGPIRFDRSRRGHQTSGQAPRVPAKRKNLAGMGKNAQALLDEGVRLQAALATADAAQEVKRLSTLPAKVRDYYAAKGRLYVGLKVINDAGHELHASDADAAGRYNLKILYRRGTKAGTTDKPAGKAGGAGDAPAKG